MNNSPDVNPKLNQEGSWPETLGGYRKHAYLEDFSDKRPEQELKIEIFQADEEDIARDEGHIIRSDN